jgi:hypothetical protein
VKGETKKNEEHTRDQTKELFFEGEACLGVNLGLLWGKIASRRRYEPAK